MPKFLEDEYALLARVNRIDHSDIVTRFAYIYKYTTSHANLVYQIVKGSRDLSRIFDQEKVNITCIGGGPGSDFLGIFKYVMLAELRPILRCILFDKERNWGECWQDADEKIESDFRLSTIFQQFVVTDMSTVEHTSKYLNSDLFTMIYFMSEVYSLRTASEPFFNNLFDKAKKGSLFLYIDNNSPVFYEWFDSFASQNSMDILKSQELEMNITDYDEEKKDLGEYWRKFTSPKLRANIAFRICRKN